MQVLYKNIAWHKIWKTTSRFGVLPNGEAASATLTGQTILDSESQDLGFSLMGNAFKFKLNLLRASIIDAVHHFLKTDCECTVQWNLIVNG